MPTTYRGQSLPLPSGTRTSQCTTRRQIPHQRCEVGACRAHNKMNLCSLNQAIRSFPKLGDYFEGHELKRPEELHNLIQELATTESIPIKQMHFQQK